jgi:hypothetical protein
MIFKLFLLLLLFINFSSIESCCLFFRIKKNNNDKVLPVKEIIVETLSDPMDLRFDHFLQEDHKKIQALIIYPNGKSACPNGDQAIAMIDSFRKKGMIEREELTVEDGRAKIITVYVKNNKK